MHRTSPLGFALLSLIVACAEEPKPAPDQTPGTASQPQTTPPPALPRPSADFAPSLTRLSDTGPYDVSVHTDVQTCAPCHAPIVKEWNASVHALASMSNPFYRFAFDDFAEKSGRDKLPFCGACHDPVLLFDGALQQPIDGASPSAHAGVNCNTCHGIESATADGNGSYVLNTTPVPIPTDGDPESLKAHLARVGMPALRTNELCVSCHRGFMSPETGHEVVISGLDEWGPFRRSGFNANKVTRIVDVPEQNCVGCHMPLTPEGHNSHRFAGGHTTLAAMTGDPEQLKAVEDLIKTAATIDVPAFGVDKVQLTDWNGVKAGQRVWLDVVVHNKNTGHMFPGGAQDLRDTWIELELTDADGAVIAHAGTEHEQSGNDPSAYVLQSFMVDDDGQRVTDHSVHDFRTSSFRHSIGPKDSAVVRYAFVAKQDHDDLRVHVRLRHRRLTKTFAEATCKHVSRPEDDTFKQGAKTFRNFSGDPCQPQPVVEIASSNVRFSETTQDWLRHYQRGQGLAHSVSESLDEAVEAFQHALRLLGPEGDAMARAKTHFELGRVLGRQGRAKDAMDQYAHAETIVGPHPAIHFGRGDAYHRVFQFKEATAWYEKAAQLADDDRIWRELAIASGSMMEAKRTLEAAQRGLAIEPRDPHLLRNQMLALKKLKAPEDAQKQAHKAYTTFERDEQAPNIQDVCAAKDDQCRKGRIPVPTIDLIAVP